MGQSCNLHGFAYTHGCPGCDEADDAEPVDLKLRWRLARLDFFPSRVAEFKGVTPDGDLDLGPWTWMRPRRGVLAGRLGSWIVGRLNGRTA